jgi:hypothetical protein
MSEMARKIEKDIIQITIKVNKLTNDLYDIGCTEHEDLLDEIRYSLINLLNKVSECYGSESNS